MLLWWRWTWSLRFCDEGLRFFSRKYCSQDYIFCEYVIPIVLALLKNSLDFFDCKDTFFLQLLDPFIDLICLQLLQGMELQILFLLKLVYIYFFPYLTWIIISLFLSFFGLDCYFFISFLLWLELLLFISFLLYLFPYLFPSLQFCTFSSLPQYFFFFAAISRNCTHTTPCLHFINNQNYIICSPTFQHFPPFWWW